MPRSAVKQDGVIPIADIFGHRFVFIELGAELVEVSRLEIDAVPRTPLAGDNSPRSTRSKVVLPEPLGPMIPILSPRMMTVEKSSMTGCCPL